MNKAGLKLLKSFEGLAPLDDQGKLRAYWDAIGRVWTGPYGFTKGVKEGMTWTLGEADDRLAKEVLEYENGVLRGCTRKPSPNELAAMTSLAWNIGLGAFSKSTVLRCHNRGDYGAAARAFGLFNQSHGNIIKGLVRRRAAEAALYLTGPTHQEYGGAAHDAREVEAEVPHLPEASLTPQKVDGESSLAKSPIMQGSVVSAVTAVLAQVGPGISQVRGIATDLGVAQYLPYGLTVVIIAGAGYAILHRYRQRKYGWA